MNRYVVAFKRGTQKSAIAAAASIKEDDLIDACDHLSQCATGLSDNSILHFPELHVVSMVLSDEKAAELRKSALVDSVRISNEFTNRSTIRPFDIREDQLAAEVVGPFPWHLAIVKADQCWKFTTGKGVKVAVIDSEIDKNLAYLPIVDGKSFNPDAPDWFGTDDFHGTFCAGIIGCRTTHPWMKGVAPECDLYALRVNKNGRGRSEYIAAAMLWAAKNKIDVVSLSQWTPDGASDPHEPPWDDVGRASDELKAAGCITIGISGNSGSKPNHWVTNPGRCESVVAVGATNEDKSWWNESSYGPPDLPESSSVEIVAPGNMVYSIMPNGGYGQGYGTSFSAPQVAGAIALIKQLQNNLAPDQLRARIKNSAKSLVFTGRDDKLGYGLLDCLASIAGLLS